jgi:hypothetical protein
LIQCSKIKTLFEENIAKEFGIKLKKTLFGKKTLKIKCLKMKRVKKLIKHGKKNLVYPFQKLVKYKTNKKLKLLNKIGKVED